MVFSPKEILLKNGTHAVIRSAEPEDSEALLQYLKVTAGETPFLLRNPDEIRITPQEERDFLLRVKEAPRDLMLLAEIDGEHAGNASFSSVGDLERIRHRCSVAIAFYRKFCGLGLGRVMLSELLATAKQAGYEQAELQVCTANARAIALYLDLGFTICGTLPRSMRYPDGSYADEYAMIKRMID